MAVKSKRKRFFYERQVAQERGEERENEVGAAAAAAATLEATAPPPAPYYCPTPFMSEIFIVPYFLMLVSITDH